MIQKSNFNGFRWSIADVDDGSRVTVVLNKKIQDKTDESPETWEEYTLHLLDNLETVKNTKIIVQFDVLFDDGMSTQSLFIVPENILVEDLIKLNDLRKEGTLIMNNIVNNEFQRRISDLKTSENPAMECKILEDTVI